MSRWKMPLQMLNIFLFPTTQVSSVCTLTSGQIKAKYAKVYPCRVEHVCIGELIVNAFSCCLRKHAAIISQMSRIMTQAQERRSMSFSNFAHKTIPLKFTVHIFVWKFKIAEICLEIHLKPDWSHSLSIRDYSGIQKPFDLRMQPSKEFPVNWHDVNQKYSHKLCYELRSDLISSNALHICHI